jgi:hypothetical protein
MKMRRRMWTKMQIGVEKLMSVCFRVHNVAVVISCCKN